MNNNPQSGQCITGDHLRVTGIGNIVEGCFNTIVGDQNVVIGDSNTVLGHYNTITGRNNTIIGVNNYVAGVNNNVSVGCSIIIGYITPPYPTRSPPESDLIKDKTQESNCCGCVICCERVACCVALPCAHMNFCVQCSRTMCSGGLVECPMCKRVVDEFKYVFQ